ncbi:MAG TPA: ABC transporter permease [Bryobacteraceae bacterium]|nr:ABC transporter permease [Bryobacteraceae bacterium]
MSDASRTAPTSLYRLLLFCYPSSFREEFGEQMTQFFREQYREAHLTHGFCGTVLLWLGVMADLVTVALKERLYMFLHDLRFSIRTLLKSPAFTAVALITIALGVGAGTTIFSVVNAVLLKPVPFRDPSRLALVYLNASERGVPRSHFSVADYVDWRTHDQAFEDGAAFGAWGRNFTLNGQGEPEQIPGIYATSSFFSILGVRPVLGRFFEPGDDQPGRTRSLVISERLWRRRGADNRIVGSTINVNGEPHTVVGIASSSFRYPNRDTEAWAILPLNPPTRRGPYYLRGLGRLKQDVSADDAQAQLRAVPLGMRTGAPPEQKSVKFAVVPLQEQMVGEVRPMLFLLLASVGVLLLIAIANVANLQITRATARAREFATRLSIGAGRWEIARQQLIESLVISVTGGALGVLLAYSAVRLLRWAAPAHLPRIDEVTVDLPVLGFAVMASIVSGLLFGLAPAVRASRGNLTASLNEGGRSGTQGRERGRLRASLAVAQIALSCILLIGAGLLIRSFVALQDVKTGIGTSGLLTVQISPSGDRYADDNFTRTFYRTLLDGVRATPGIEAAAVSSTVPPGQGGFSENITIEGSEGESPIVLLPIVHPDYFRTMSIPLRAGRYFGDGDTAEGARVTIVSEALARRWFPNQNAVGKRLKIGGRERPNAPWYEIVGVVGDVRYRALEAQVEPVFYIPHTQNTVRSMYLVVRSSLPASSIRTAVRQQVGTLDRGIPVPEPKRIDDLLHESVAQPRFRTFLIATFALVALLIAGVGLYGVVAYGVMQRLPEIGIRIALGAQSRTVSVMILREAAWIAALGIAAGLVGAMALQKLVSTFLFGVKATDVPTFAAVVAVLVASCLLASYVPARRASRVDPMISMKAS